MDLCQDCCEFAIAISKRSKSWLRPHAFWNAATLRSGSCRLCKMISDYILDNTYDSISTLGEYVEFRYSSFEDILVPRPLSCVWLGTGHVGMEMNVWSDPDSPAALSGAVCHKPPLPSDHCSAAFEHINSWIEDCHLNHEECKFTIAGNLVNETHGPKLPTRVLDLRCADNTDLSLIETQGERGEYCALSYCWGSPGMNHLLTTRASIKFHFNGIKFDQLPRTLQDAVIVTRRIGIRYLWVDSLCIIQGDEADWTTQSAKMAEVYQNAHLVIAASGAVHPGKGCFSSKRRCSTSVEIPHFSEALQMMGSIRLSMRLLGDDSPVFGPLQERGWAMQERMLARRTLHFMPAGISWRCRELQTGERYPYDLGQYTEWDAILEAYSTCQLTYVKDRLVALEGLGKAIQEANDDRYTFGIFESQIPEFLLWYTKYDETDALEDLVSVPTWSWASKGGEKVFWIIQDVLGKSMIDNAELAIDKSGTLRIKGILQECKVSTTAIHGFELPNQKQHHPGLRYRRDLHRIERLPATSGFTSIAAFDSQYTETVTVLFLNELKHHKRVRPEEVVYAVLLLVPNDDMANSFRRVGMGFIANNSDIGDLSSAFEVIYIL